MVSGAESFIRGAVFCVAAVTWATGGVLSLLLFAHGFIGGFADLAMRLSGHGSVYSNLPVPWWAQALVGAVGVAVAGGVVNWFAHRGNDRW